MCDDPAWVEGTAILLAVAICSVVTATNDYNKENKFRELFEIEQEKKEIEVVRGGRRRAISPEDVVVGDLVVLKSGMDIVGDGVVVEASQVEVDESSMSGESEPQRKDILRRCLIEREKAASHPSAAHYKQVPSPVLLAGTKVAQVESGAGWRGPLHCNQRGQELRHRQHHFAGGHQGRE